MLVADKYELLEHLGGGAYGEVWVAKQTTFDRRVALKFLKVGGDSARQRFKLEATALARLDHPNCVTVHDFGVFHGTPYLVTEFVRGKTLDRWLATNPSQQHIISVASDLASALHHAHSQQIVHRDVKLANIVVNDDDHPRPTLLDFGVAKLAGLTQSDVTKTGEIIGTPGYMSPEQLRAGTIGPASDVYSFGVVLFEMFAKSPPFRGESQLDLAMMHLTAQPPPLHAAPQPIAECVARMLAKDPEARPAMREVRRVLRAKMRTRQLTPRPTEIIESANPPQIPKWLLAIGASALLLIAGVLIGQQDDPVVRPHVRTSSPSLVKSPASLDEPVSEVSDPPPSPSTEDLGRTEELGTRPVRCEIAAGTYWFDVPGGDYGIRVPSAYDGEPAPVILMLHDILQPPSDLLEIEALNELADREGLVLIAPDDNDVKDTWLSVSDIDRVVRSLDDAAHRGCVDLERLYVIGHGNGGIAAKEVACRIPVVAMAHSSHRLGGDGGGLCETSSDVPTMVVSMLDDPTNPIAAMPDCLGHEKWSLAEHERLTREAHRCVDDYRDGGAICQDLDCKVALRLCHPPGGRDWKAMRKRVVTNNPILCDSPPGDFDFVAEIWAFFRSQSG